MIKIKRTVTTRDIAKASKIEKSAVDKAVFELRSKQKVEYVSYGGVTCVKTVGTDES